MNYNEKELFKISKFKSRLWLIKSKVSQKYNSNSLS